MKKIAISLAALAVVASAVYAGPKEDADQGPTGVGEGVLDCSGEAITCGGSASGPLGPGGTVAAYGCTTLSYDGAEEAVVPFCVGAQGTVSVDMTYAHSSGNDLDLFILGSCDPGDCLGAATGTSGAENVTLALGAGTYYAVVDGWNGLADGSGYDLSVACDTPCSTPTIESTWGSVKSVYAN
jgi:hypothetical protein